MNWLTSTDNITIEKRRCEECNGPWILNTHGTKDKQYLSLCRKCHEAAHPEFAYPVDTNYSYDKDA